ncbi:MAG: ATP-binding protein, partial [Oscillospiraceae bacterium]
NDLAFRGNKTLLHILIYNLVTNAIKYNKQDGSIIVSDGFVQNQYFISIADSGIGMSDFQIENIYSGTYQNYAVDINGKVAAWGLKGYLMGTDGLGRDVFSRLIAGGRMTLTIGAIAVIISTIIGILIGGL